LTSPASGIPPHAQNAIVGRFLGFRALAPSLPAIELHSNRDTADRLALRLCWLTNEVLEDPDSTQTPGEFLRNLVRRLNDEVLGLSDACRSAAQPVIEELRALVAEYEAAPYDPLRKLTDAAARTAADYYAEFAAVPDELWKSTLPRFSWVNGIIRLSFISTIHVQLWTEFGHYHYPTAQVMVKIPPRWLDQETIAALPRSLLHEYVAHVPQGPHSGRRLNPDASDMFAEGWMDYVAHLIFEEAIQRQEPSLQLGVSPDPAWIVLHELAADRFFNARRSLSESDRTAAARYLGVATARQLHLLLGRLPATKGSPREYLYRLSLGLNVSQLDNVARARFAANVQLSMRLGSRSDALITPLCEWAAGNISSEELFERVINSRIQTSVDVR
jgi:hypothetical protein